MRRGSISAEFGSNTTKEKIMAASGEAKVGDQRKSGAQNMTDSKP